MVSVVDAQVSRGKKVAAEIKVWKKSGTVSSAQAADRLLKKFGLTDLPNDKLDHIRAALESTFLDGTDDQRDPEIQKMYGNRNAAMISCQHALAEQAGARWTTFGHTDQPVTTTAWGRWAEQFGGEYDNTQIGLRLKVLLIR